MEDLSGQVKPWGKERGEQSRKGGGQLRRWWKEGIGSRRRGMIQGEGDDVR